MTALQPLPTRDILEQMLLDYFVARRRALLNELVEVNRSLEHLRNGQMTKAERERVAYEGRHGRSE